MKKFLVIQTAFLGDAVLASALLEKLHTFFPDAAIDIVVRKGNEGLFDGHPFLRKLFVWDKGSHKTANLFGVIRGLRKEHYDHIINCQRFFSTGLMTVLARGGEKIGYDKNPLSAFFTRRVEHMIPDPADLRRLQGKGASPFVHEVDRSNALIAHLTDASRPMPKLHPSAQHAKDVARSRPYVCIAPASVWFTKQWPEGKWADLIRSIPGNFDVLLLGAPSDADTCSRIARAAGRGEVLAGTLSLLRTAALMAKATMNYVNDSAPLHIASAMSAPVTAIFCSTVPAFGFGPLGGNGRVVEISLPLDCRPCGLHGYRACPKGHFKCALSIDARSVIAQ